MPTKLPDRSSDAFRSSTCCWPAWLRSPTTGHQPPPRRRSVTIRTISQPWRAWLAYRSISVRSGPERRRDPGTPRSGRVLPAAPVHVPGPQLSHRHGNQARAFPDSQIPRSATVFPAASISSDKNGKCAVSGMIRERLRLGPAAVRRYTSPAVSADRADSRPAARVKCPRSTLPLYLLGLLGPIRHQLEYCIYESRDGSDE